MKMKTSAPTRRDYSSDRWQNMKGDSNVMLNVGMMSWMAACSKNSSVRENLECLFRIGVMERKTTFARNSVSSTDLRISSWEGHLDFGPGGI